MAAKYIYRNGFLLLLFNFISTAALEKRFSDLKRCADEDCSMLLVRGKAVNDFQGPDCRFLSFKKSETIYVYYKLAGRRADMWAGSVGSNFGYFPKDLLAINHIYTDKEFEVPAEETDFVCFETGFDKFQSYDIDHLLGFVKNNVDVSNITSGHIKEAIRTDTKPSVEQISEDDIIVPDEESASLFEPEIDTELPSIGTETQPDTTVQDSENEQLTTPEPILENVMPDLNETEEVSLQQEEEETQPQDIFEPEPHVSPSENAQIPEIKTSYGTTFDAIVTEETTTAQTTPQEENKVEEFEMQQDEKEPQAESPPLLTFAEDHVQSMDTVVEKEQEMEKQDDKDSMWSSLGDAVFSVVTGGEKPTHDGDVNSDEDEDDEEEETTPPPKTFEEIKADKQPLDIKYREPVEPPTLISKPEEASHESLHQVDDTKPSSESNKLIFDEDSDGDVVGPEETDVKMVEQTTEEGQQIEVVHSSEPVIQDEANENVKIQKSTLENKMNEPTEDKEKLASGSIITNVKKVLQERSHVIHQERHLEESTSVDNKLEIAEVKSNAEMSIVGEISSSEFDIKDDKETTMEESLDQKLDNVENLSQSEISVLMEDISEEIVQHLPEVEEVKKEELLEDENALSFSHLDSSDADTAQTESPNVPETPTPEHSDNSENSESTATQEDSHSDILSSETVPAMSTPEPEIVYSEDVMRLSILRDYLTEDKIVRCQKYLGLKNLFKLEAMFEDLDTELQATRQSQIGSVQEIENSLERILETSENAILDQVEKILDSRESKYRDDVQRTDTNIDEETEILDDFQEIAFILRHKHSTISDSVPLAEVKEEEDKDEHELNVKEDVPLVVEDIDTENYTEPKTDHNLTATHLEQDEPAADVKKEGIILDQVHTAADVSVEEDSGHFNKNKDNQQSFGQADDLPKIPQATLENPLDMGLGVEVENSGSGTLESIEPPSEFHEEEVGLFSTVLVYLDCTFSMIKTKTSECTTVMISLLPDEWRPGETLFGCPWQAVVVTALLGILTFTLFFWRTVLAVKKREYLVDHKKLDEQIESLKKEKNGALIKITELQKQTELLKDSQKQSAETANTTQKRMQALETRVTEAKKLKEQMLQEKGRYMELLEEERANCQKNETRIEKLEKANEKLQQSRKKIQETLAKTTVLLDEAKIREDARNVQQKSLEKDYAALKEENKSLKATIKSWEDRHRELSDQIKVYQKSQKELEDSLVQKDHNIEVLSDLLSDLDACDLQKGDPKVCANGEISIDKTAAIKNRIKQMMDVSRVQTTLTVVEEERDRFMAKLLSEEKTRNALEEQHQELEHTISTLKSEKSHVENQFKILQQKNEIIVEMYQQKESALQQRLTKEEMERRSKENMLTEVGGKATEAEEQVKVLRQRINEMEDQMKKTEEMYKEQIKEQENKTHSNWINARNAERALNQEKQEASKLREKLAVLTSQLNEKRAPLFRPNSGQFAGPRQGDSYGPSPVSGGAPSPPIMIEGPRRPPSAPVGRKIDPYGPRPPSDPHGRYAENKHMSGMEMMGPRNSSPANMDAPPQVIEPQVKAEAQVSSESPDPGIGSFIASPIRDSPGPAVPGPPPGPGPHEPLLPPGGPHGRLPPPGPYRPMRPGPYPFHPPGPGLPPPLPHHGPPLPANGHPGLPMGGEFGPRASNGHAFQPRHGPVHMDPRGPPPPHFRPPPPNFGPMPPPHIVRASMGPHPPMHPDMRYPGPRASPPMDFPPGALPPGVRPPGPLPPGLPPVHPSHSGPYGQPPPDSLQNSPGAHSNPGPPQDAVRNAGTEP